MEESKIPIAGEETPAPEQVSGAVQPSEPRAHVVLLVMFFLFVAFALLSRMLSVLIAELAGWDMDLVDGKLAADAGAEARWIVRAVLGLNHLFSFSLAGLGTILLFYRRYRVERADRPARTWRDYLGIRSAPEPMTIGLTLLLMLVALPMVMYSYQLNKLVPLPEVFQVLERQTEEALKGLLQMENPAELLANLFLIALLPALGEELIFRGVLQQQMRRLASPWAAVILTAAIFSFIHFQFAGFLPRFLLGIILGWLYWQTKNFWVPVIAHFFNNGLLIVVQFLFRHKFSTIDLEKDIAIPIFPAILSTLLTAAIMYAIWRRGLDT